ncbi:MAG: TetR/AcrR family transcriptional regulator [Actinobacteria bacterium]|nr:TetR/AcrR family transcriptional regulator [Actinomycetota bacterium]
MNNLHPTKATLIATTVKLLNERALTEIRSDEVLEISGVSKGSLYHHFNDFSDLINTALVARFAEEVDFNIELIANTLARATSKEELFQGLAQVTIATQKPESRSIRFERARVLALSEESPQLSAELGAEQDRLTEAVTDLVLESINKGFIRSDLDPRAIAVFIQAYSLGTVVDDVAGEHVNPEAYYKLIDTVLRASLATV